MKIFSEKKQIQKYAEQIRKNRETIGFVPTMGALHDGHLSLVEQALENNDKVVVSIFVNPTQFDNPEDLKKYPRTLKDDTDRLASVSKDIVVYAPSTDDIYEGHTVADTFSFDGLEEEMEGQFRAGHFDGVGTIVKRLFEIIRPHCAYFGEKDFQQLMIVKKLVEKYDIPVEIVGCEIHREPSGLAMSSRNERLKPQFREAAPLIYKVLRTAKLKFGIESANKVTEWVQEQFDNQDLLKLEYFTIADTKTLKPIKRKTKKRNYRAFIAVYADDIRLIDNIALN